MSADEVLNLAEIDAVAVAQLLARYGLELRAVVSGETIPGSWWGDREAGLRGAVLHARPDTPVHSVLHEACHFVCMTPSRRLALDTDAGGDFDEENAVCYLQVLLADELPRVGRARMFADMDAWGYTFRLGSARAWFESDADDARAWLRARGLIDDADRPTWRVRET
ncbi:hypothetical protein [Wenzhouxiangella sp. XN24]|uniref:hypothetical protein n=1 Tax=Wenzhouxiangella sp. XN24 TaxID=2713569 RepID=UPI0013EBF112|nr:hypothetical protein [Wenzhouxiangella sp. XN24]NGX14752.1 hypothetical protein [Wenzhouxiangella sp. XN24]